MQCSQEDYPDGDRNNIINVYLIFTAINSSLEYVRSGVQPIIGSLINWV